MYIIIGSHFVPLEGKFVLVALVIVRITFLKQVEGTLSKCLRVWEQVLNDGHTVVSGHLGAFDAL